VILDGGTTALPADLAVTVVTHSPTVAAALVEHPAAEAAERISADKFFLGVTGVHPEAGLTAGEAAMKRLLVRRAADTYVLASAEKIGAASAFEVLPLADVAGIITDAPADDPTIHKLDNVIRAWRRARAATGASRRRSG
jgi:DeoR/GlpR family transcriptional regulator of sugar metabolism